MVDDFYSSEVRTEVSPTAAAVSTFVDLASDDTGATTFERFVWQAKLAVRRWLATFAADGPIAVMCEHVEDLVIVHFTDRRSHDYAAELR